jgi:hypothetical protein
MTNKGAFIMKHSITALGIIGTIAFFFIIVGVSQAISPTKDKGHGSSGLDVSITPGQKPFQPIPYPKSVNKTKGANRTMKKIVPLSRKSTGDDAGTAPPLNVGGPVVGGPVVGGPVLLKSMDSMKKGKGSVKVKEDVVNRRSFPRKR